MKLKNCHILYDPNKDNVVILHRPGDGSPMQAMEANVEFVHAMIQWGQEATLAVGFWGGIWARIRWILGRKTKSTRVIRDRYGAIYTITLTKKEGKHAQEVAEEPAESQA